MGDYEAAVKQLGMVICPACGEMRAVERLNRLIWHCIVCAKNFSVIPRTP